MRHTGHMDTCCSKIFEWNSSKGPWLGREFQRINQEGLKYLVERLGPGSPQFENRREHCCWDMGIDYDTDPDLVFARIIDLDCWEWVGPYAPSLRLCIVSAQILFGLQGVDISACAGKPRSLDVKCVRTINIDKSWKHVYHKFFMYSTWVMFIARRYGHGGS
jgi:hypothetical protein